jgi:hypothetical protein
MIAGWFCLNLCAREAPQILSMFGAAGVVSFIRGMMRSRYPGAMIRRGARLLITTAAHV